MEPLDDNKISMTGFLHEPDINGLLDEFEEQESQLDQTSINPTNMELTPRPTEAQQRVMIREALDEFSSGIGVLDQSQKRARNLRFSDGIYSDKEVSDRNAAMRLSQDTGVNPEIIEAELLDSSPEQIKARSRTDLISKLYPSIANWGSNPINYPLISKDVDYMMATGKNLELLNPKKQSDFSKAIDKSVLRYQRALVDINMMLGVIDLEDGKRMLRELDIEESRLQYVEALPALKEMERESGEFSEALGALFNEVSGTYDAIADRNFRTTIERLGSTAQAGGSVLGELYDAAAAIYSDPEAAKVFTTEALMSSAPSIAAGVGGGILGGKILGPIGAVAGGMSSAALVGLPLEFSAKLQEEMQEYRDPETGLIDYDAAFSDPERVSRWRKEAAIFGGTIAASEAVFSQIIGKPFAKIISKAPGGTAVKGVAAVGSEAVVGGIEEGASNLTAEAAVLASRGELTAENLAKESAGVAGDIIGGGVAGGTLGSTIGAGRYLLDNGAQKFSKLRDTIQKTNKAVSDTVQLSNTRAKLKESPIAEQNPEQMKDLINEATKGDIAPSEVFVDDDPETVSASDIRIHEESASAGTVSFTPSKLESFFVDRGTTVEAALSNAPVEIMEQFRANRRTDTAVTVPIADWIYVTANHPEVDAIVRINDNELSADEATEIQNEIEQQPFDLFQERPPELPPTPDQEPALPPTPDQEPPTISQTVIEPEAETPAIALEDIPSRFRVEGEAQAFKTVQRIIRRTVKGVPKINSEARSLIEEIQFKRVVHRAEALGMSANELANELDAQYKRGAGGAQGVFRFIRGQEGGVISLASDADPSTIIHELGHSWLHEMSLDYGKLAEIPFEQMNEAQKAYWHSMELAAEFFELDNIAQLNSLDDAKFTEIQERFAQTTEKYFLEGEFGGARLRALMERFRKFLVEIAEVVGTAYKHWPALRINKKVERMFEGILSPEKISADVFIPLFLDPMIPVESLGGERLANYYKNTKDALAASASKFKSKVASMNFREREALIDSVRNEAYDQAEAEVNALPEIRLTDAIAESYADYQRVRKDNPEAPEPRISWASFQALMGPDNAKRMRKSLRNIVAPAKKGGVDIASVMYANQIHDQGEMRRMLNVASRKQELIEREADRIAKEIMPPLKSDDDIITEADNALADADLNKIFRDELKILAEDNLPSIMNIGEVMGRSPESWLNDSATSMESDKQVYNSPARGFNSRKYRHDFRRFSSQAAKAFRQGDFARAFTNKVKSIIAYKSFRSAINIVPMLERNRKYFEQFRKSAMDRSQAKRLDADIMRFGVQLLIAIQNGQRILPKLFTPDPASPLRMVIPEGSGVNTEQVLNINELINRFELSTQKSGMGNMSVNSAIQLYNVMRSLKSIASKAKQIEIAGRNELTDDVATQLVMEFEGSLSGVRDYDSSVSPFVAGFRVAKDQVQTVFNSMYQTDQEYNDGAMGRLFAEVDDKQAEYNLEYEASKKTIIDAIKNAIKSGRDKGAFEKLLAPTLRRIPYAAGIKNIKSKYSGPINSPELNMTFESIGHYWIAELLMGSESGARKFLLQRTAQNPDGMSTIDIETGLVDRTPFNNLRARLIQEGILTKEHFDMFKTIWDTFAGINPRLRDTVRRTDDFIMGSIEGSSFEAFGTKYSGGYFPVSNITEIKVTTDMDSMLDASISHMPVNSMYPAISMGNTRSRLDNYGELDLDFNKTLIYLSTALRIIHLRPSLLTIGKLFNRPDVQAALEAKRPGALKNVVVPWVQRVANQQRTKGSDEWMDFIANKARRNIAVMLYSGNIGTAAIQASGLTPAAVKIGPQHMAYGAARVARNPLYWRRFMMSSSAPMRFRMQGGIRRHLDNYEDMMRLVDAGATASEIGEKMSFFHIQAAQNQVDVIVWTSEYLRQMRNKKDLPEAQAHEDAVRSANFVVNSTQASSDVSWLNSWQSTQASKKLFTGIATSFVFSMNNVVTREAARGTTKWNRAALTVAAGMAFILTNQVVEQAIRGALEDAYDMLWGDDEEELEDENATREYMLKSAAGALSIYLPIVGAIPESIVYRGEPDFAPAATVIGRNATNAIRGVSRMSIGAPLTVPEIKGILNTLTAFTMLPASFFARDYFIENVLIEGIFNETIEDRQADRRYILRNERHNN